MSVEVFGNRVILENLDKLLPTTRAAIQPVMVEAAAVGEQVMKANARVDTGEMQGATYTDVRDDQIVFGDDSPHAIFNELGTSKMSAQPFIVPGALAGGEYLMANIHDIL